MKLNLKRTLLVGIAFMTISAFWQLYDYEIQLILKNEFFFSDTLTGFVMSIDNILAVLLLPLFGSISDKTMTKYGKRMPFIVVGTVLTFIGMWVLPHSAQTRNLVLFLIALGAVLLAMSIYRSPAVALMPDVTIKPLRSQGNAIINLMGAVGGVVTLVLISFLAPDKVQSYFPLFIAVAAFMLIGIVVMMVLVKEVQWAKDMQTESERLGIIDEEEEHFQDGKMDPEVRRSLTYILLSIALWFMGYNAVISAFSRYATIHIGLTQQQGSQILIFANVGAILAFIPIGRLSSQIGRKRMINYGILILAFAFGTAFFYQGFHVLMFANFLLAGIGWAAINVNSLPMVLEMAKGSDVGKYTGLYYTFSMSAQIVTPILSGVLFDLFDYSVLFPYATFFVLLALITMSQVHHGDTTVTKYTK